MHPPTRMGRGPSRIQLKPEDLARVKTPEDEDKDCVWVTCPEVKLKDAKPREDTGLSLRSSSKEGYDTLDNHAAQLPRAFNTTPGNARPSPQRDVTDMPNANDGQAPGPRDRSRIHGDDLEANIIDDENSGALPDETWILLFAVMVFILFLALLYFGLGIWAIVTHGYRVLNIVKRWTGGVDVSGINGNG